MTTEKEKDVWLVTRYEAARAVLSDTRFSSDSRNPSFPLYRDFSALIRMDPPEHTMYRRMLAPEFLTKRVTELRPEVVRLTNELLDGVVCRKPPVDLVPSLAMPLPSLVICRILGVPYEDHRFLQDRTATALHMTSTEEEISGAVAELGEYMGGVVRAKIARPEGDLLSRLVVGHIEPGNCTAETAADLARLLLVAGHVTTVNMIGLGILTLLQNPAQLAQLRQDPQLIPAAVEELLRYLSVASAVGRVATEDIHVGEHLVREGEGVMVLLAVANRDDRRYAMANKLDIERGGHGHLAFGYGPHVCIGAALARMELQIAIEAVIRRFPNLRLAVSMDRVAFRHEMRMYGVHELPVEW
ncbi:cytochrome P450 [Streptomyces sp. NPDC058682]|uniref:cytochrome P450 n=1 Tax=Streptomyces sp. NPDC058682 TaxID=3346596 RepID=UPI00364AAD05